MASGYCQNQIDRQNHCHHPCQVQRIKLLLQGNISKSRQNHGKHKLESGYTQHRNHQRDPCHDSRHHHPSLTSPAPFRMKIKHGYRRHQNSRHCNIVNPRQMKLRISMRNPSKKQGYIPQHNSLCQKSCRRNGGHSADHMK